MSYTRFAKDWSEAHCRQCMHTNEPNADGSCSAYGYNGVDCQAQPCVCRNHVVKVHEQPPPQPAPDAEGEWTLHEGEDYIVVLGGEYDTTENPIARCYNLEHAAQIVRDHTQAAAAPKLVVALKAAVHAMKSYYFGNGSADLANEVEALANAALASAQTQKDK